MLGRAIGLLLRLKIMSNEVSNADIYNVLINMRGDLGRLEGKVDGHGDKLLAQKEEHDALQADVQKIQMSHARQRGFVAAISTIGAVIGASLGAAVDVFVKNK
jgi:hypothetical protein